MSKKFAKQRIALPALLALGALNLAGCSTLLPKKHQAAIAGFATYGQARGAYDKVVPNQTSVADLKTIGFDPDRTPNIEQVNYLQVLQAFLPHPGVSYSTIPPSVQTCIAAQTRCVGYVIDPKVSNEKRVGSAVLDVLNFRRKTVTTGWTAKMMFVLLDGVVVYKIWSGEPNVDSSSTSINPLGPLQNIGGVLERYIPY